jgi:Tfp pilus assembly protein PilZ
MNLNIQALGRRLGRRAHDRFTVPGAVVSWAPIWQKSIITETSPLSDISRGGLSLLTNGPTAVGSEITLRLFLPGKTGSFDLLGKVIYCNPRGPSLTYGYRIGVELMPFTQTVGYNSLQTLNTIEALERTYGKRKRK